MRIYKTNCSYVRTPHTQHICHCAHLLFLHNTHTQNTHVHNQNKEKNTKTKKNWYDSEKAKKKHLHHRTIQQVVHFFL